MIRTEAQRRVTTTLLSCFPTTFTHHPLPEQKTPLLPGPMRRAITYLDEHLDDPIDLAHLAAAARIPPRQLTLAFRHHLSTTPGSYLLSMPSEY